LNKETKIFVSTFMTLLLLLGFSSGTGKQFFSVHAQSDDDNTYNKMQEQSEPESSETSFTDDNFTVVTPNNFTNQTVTDFNMTGIDEASQEDISAEDINTSDEVITESVEDPQQTDIPIGPEEIPVSKEISEEQVEDQENLGLQNVSDDLQNINTKASNLSEVEMFNNFTESADSLDNATDDREDLRAIEPQEQDLKVSSAEVQNGSREVTDENPLAEEVTDIDLLGANVTVDLPLEPETEGPDNMTEEITSSPSMNLSAKEPLGGDTLAQIMPAEEILGNLTSEEIDAAASNIAGITNATSAIENNQVSNIQNVINSIALGSGQSGGNPQQIANQISKEIVANSNGPVAKAIQTLAAEFSEGNSDEINIAAMQIGALIAEGNNIQQTLVQVTNNVVNNIQNIKTSIENYDTVVVNPKISSNDKKIIQQTIDVIKKSKTEVDVPRIHIKFHTHERNLVLRILSTSNYKYEMPFSKYNGAFKLDDDEFRVEVLSGDGSVQSASVAKMFKSGKIGDREFLDKDVRNGKVFFSLDDVNDGKYLLEVYVKLSNGSIGTFARGSVSIR
jgi:hypothetical protein